MNKPVNKWSRVRLTAKQLVNQIVHLTNGLDMDLSEVRDYLFNSIDMEEYFDEELKEIYGEYTKVGWIEVDTVSFLKRHYEDDYRIAKQEYFDNEIYDESIIYIPRYAEDGLNDYEADSYDEECEYYYHRCDLENFIEDWIQGKYRKTHEILPVHSSDTKILTKFNYGD